MNNRLLDPIPSIPFPNTAGIQIIATDDPLICISECMQDAFLFQPCYFEQGIDGATDKIYVRKTVAQMLLQASQNLPEGYQLKILDAWRPPAVQKALFDNYYNILCNAPENASKSKEELLEMAMQFVSYPSEDPKSPFVHATGGAVDLTIVDENGKELDMGTVFDDFSEVAHTDYFESSTSICIRNNRRMLYNAMIAAGFTNFTSEWWHYDFGDRFWAAMTRQDSIYEGIYEEPVFCF